MRRSRATAVRQVLRAIVYSQVEMAARPSNFGSACQTFTNVVCARSSANTGSRTIETARCMTF
jgi:hypothetical protein